MLIRSCLYVASMLGVMYAAHLLLEWRMEDNASKNRAIAEKNETIRREAVSFLQFVIFRDNPRRDFLIFV